MNEMTECEKFLIEEIKFLREDHRMANDIILLNTYLKEDFIDFLSEKELLVEFKEFQLARKPKYKLIVSEESYQKAKEEIEKLSKD